MACCKTILDEVKAVHPCTNLQVGIMIEVPSAALLAPILAKEVDFSVSEQMT